MYIKHYNEHVTKYLQQELESNFKMVIIYLKKFNNDNKYKNGHIFLKPFCHQLATL